jgi:hypothetical protein
MQMPQRPAPPPANWAQPPPGYQRWQPTPPTGQAPPQQTRWGPADLSGQRQANSEQAMLQQQPAGGSAGSQMTGGGALQTQGPESLGGQMSDMRQQLGRQEQMASDQMNQVYQQRQRPGMGGGQDRPAPFGGSGPPFGEHMGGNPFAGNPFGGGEGAPPTFPPRPRAKPKGKPAARKGAPAKAGAKSSSKAPPKASAKKAPPFKKGK